MLNAAALFLRCHSVDHTRLIVCAKFQFDGVYCAHIDFIDVKEKHTNIQCNITQRNANAITLPTDKTIVPT